MYGGASLIFYYQLRKNEKKSQIKPKEKTYDYFINHEHVIVHER
jgi:hypothetical protein